MDRVTAGAGHSTAEDSHAAGREAVSGAVADADGAVEVVYLFTSSEHDAGALVDGADEATDATVLGCTTAGEIVDTGSHTESAGALALGGRAVEAGVGHAEYDADTHDPYGAARRATNDACSALGTDRIATNVLERSGGDWTPFPGVVGTVFADYDADQQAVMEAVTDRVGPMSVHGGLAADDWKYDCSARVFHDRTVVESGLVVAALDLDVRTGHAIRHGLSAGSDSWTITGIEGETVTEFDGRPALDVYEERFGSRVSSPQFRITKPLGFDVGDDEPRIYVPYAIDEDERTMTFTNGDQLQAGWTGTVMDPSESAVVEGATDAVEAAMARAGDPDPDEIAAVMVHDCLSRWFFLSDTETRERELDAIRDRVGADTPIVGWYTAGELSAPDALGCAFDQTIVVWVITTTPL